MLQVYMCKICGEEKEDLCHFILSCRGIRERDERMVERMRGVDEVETLDKLLFTGGHVQGVKPCVTADAATSQC